LSAARRNRPGENLAVSAFNLEAHPMRANPRCFLLLPLLLHNAWAAGPVSIKIQAGDISAAAFGDGARASVDIGGLPGPAKPGCGRVEVKVGNIQKTAQGRNAAASVSLPETQANCEEKHP
jgi:hypothetical protein